MLRYRLGLYDFEPAPKGLQPPWLYKREDRAVSRDWRAVLPHLTLADAATRARIVALQVQEQKALEPSWAMDADFTVPMPPGEALRPYQTAGVAFAMQRECTLIADVPRLGKSAQAIGVFNKMRGTTALIICPSVAKPQWLKYVHRWAVGSSTAQIVEGLSDTLRGDILIINWEILDTYREELAAKHFDVVVYDECRAMKSEKSARTKAALAMRGTKHLFLDGTPINTRPIDLWPVIRRCDRYGLGKSKTDFAKRYCDAERIPGEWHPDGASNMEELQRRLRKTFMIRREKTEATHERKFVWLPNGGFEEMLATERALFIGADTRPLHEIIADRLESEEPPSEELASARQALAQAKLAHVYDYIDGLLAQSKKVVVFAYHRAITTALAAHYEDAAMVIGGLTPKQRQVAIDRFQDDPGCRVFVGNITSCSSAISLSAANDVVYAELSWVPTEMEQSEDRPWLPSKDSLITSHWLMFEDSLDAAMHTILIDRMREIGAALNKDRL